MSQTYQSYIVTAKDAVEKKKLIDEMIADEVGGKVTHEYTLNHMFAIELPDDHVSTFETHPAVVSMEKDGTVTTQ